MRVAELDEAIRAKIATLPLLEGHSPESWTVEPLGGLTNRSLKLSHAGDSYVLRLPGSGTERYLDRAREAYNARLAADAGLSPEILYHDPSDGTMVTRFIDGAVVLDEERLRDPSTLRAVVDRLKHLHHRTGTFRGKMRLFPKLDEYLDLAANGDRALLANLLEARAEADCLRSGLDRQSTGRVSCHIDPAPHNFLAARQPDGTERLYLLDWEYSAVCEPSWDLGVLSTEAGFDRNQDAAMIEHYYGTVSDAGFDRLLVYKAGLHLLAAAWALVQLASGNENTDFRLFSAERLELFREAMADPRLRSHMAARV